MDNIGEQHRYLLVLRRLGGLFERRTALVAELGGRRQFCAARPAGHTGRRQRTAIVPSVLHVSIVSLLVNDVRHIAVPSPRRSFETSYVSFEMAFSSAGASRAIR